MSEQESVQLFMQRLRGLFHDAITQPDINIAWDNVEALVIADRKATVERCREAVRAASLQVTNPDINIGLALAIGALDAVLEESK